MVNLTAEESTCHVIMSLPSDPDFFVFLLKYILRSDSPLADAACQILSNLSRHDACADRLVRTMKTHNETIGFQKLIQVQ